jgi:hypothetical protein
MLALSLQPLLFCPVLLLLCQVLLLLLLLPELQHVLQHVQL